MKGKIPKRSDGSFSDSSNTCSFVRQVCVLYFLLPLISVI